MALPVEEAKRLQHRIKRILFRKGLLQDLGKLRKAD
eukprot:CAMPEP_0115102614 /NCGR_PEP_ID=MMETSP0227-20121206/34020_1 /TAXON_ID=89957 /ORGANISM="Polarella glacialis, Strain CCMP 1383" /LENGTH=35 /DNA_ID= /DNA_START= /DNA_END= /DNA_ORIENTATION=